MLIQQLAIQTSQITELDFFYREILQLQVINFRDEKIIIHTAQSRLVFTTAHKSEPVYHFAFTIPANKIEEAKKWLENKVSLLWMEDYKGDIADFVNWKAKSIYFYDPAGNIVEFIARFDLDNASTEPFSSAQLLSISEAGLVFPAKQLDSKTNMLLTQYPLTYFDKQPPLPQFKAVGDEEGLFVIVPEHRNWFPTTMPSGIFPLEVNFMQQGKSYTFSY
ncbi:MAG TPA: hypothetical protein VF487_00190 [Chitinophagaceae bacterium]